MGGFTGQSGLAYAGITVDQDQIGCEVEVELGPSDEGTDGFELGLAASHGDRGLIPGVVTGLWW